ncbi:hypothetical protein [Methylorubrum extorquens]
MGQTTMMKSNTSGFEALARWRRVLLGSSLAGIGLLGLAGAAGAAPRPDYTTERGIFLPFLNAPEPGTEAERSPRLGLSFGSEVHPVLMDTGSTGIVVSASRIPDINDLPSRPGRLTYSSSGRIMIGRWVTVSVTLWGRDGASVSTNPLPVLAVDRIECAPNARNCTPTEAPRGVAMMGVGFGREGDSQAQSTPDTNPLLNALPPGSGPIHHGYVVTREGVHVGLTRANSRGDFRFVKLDPNPAVAGDWLGIPVCVVVNDQEPSACGRGLIDTGVTGMFLTLPPDQVANNVGPDPEGRDALLPGTRLRFRFGEAAAYGFTVDDADAPLAPTRIVLNTRRPQPFVNTGLHVLNGFDVLYDADGGYYAFHARNGLHAEGR